MKTRGITHTICVKREKHSVYTTSSRDWFALWQLQCSIYNEVRHERQVVSMLLDKTAKCGQVAFDILGLLVDTNAKQNVCTNLIHL